MTSQGREKADSHFIQLFVDLLIIFIVFTQLRDQGSICESE